MTELTLSKKQEVLNEAALETLPRLEVAVLRNTMVDPLETILRYAAYVEGFDARLTFGGFDTMYREAIEDSPELVSSDTGCVLVFDFLARESPALAHGFAAMTADEVAEEAELIVQRIAAILAGARRQTSAMILWHSFEEPVDPALGIYDAHATRGQRETIRRLNDDVRKLVAETGNAYVVDMNLPLARVGAERFYDARFWHRTRLPYTIEALEAVAREEMKFLRPIMGRARKCLVLDCDNVLWGGVVGEDGLSGIALDTAHPGSSYREFQQEVLNLHHRGVLLALCSKNNEDDVWEVFDNHPSMVLERRHITAARINWEDKAKNLRELATELNIGLDSFVLVDDAAFEVELVRKMVPEVDVIHIPKESAPSAREVLAAYGKFDTLALSAEDRARGEMYRADAERKKLRHELTDMASYYRSLEMTVSIELDSDFAIPRIAQQTQKTNQFNLTTRRYTEADIRRFMESGSHDVLSLSVSDRLGDLGIVGTCILRYERDDAVVDTLLLSCRALGRELETVLLYHAIRRAQHRGAQRVVGHYLPTAKNAQAAGFYADHGFEHLREDAFAFATENPVPEDPDFFRSVATTT